MKIFSTIRFRRGTSAEWSTANPILDQGEPGYEIDTGMFKIGDGISTWDATSYIGSTGGVGGEGGESPLLRSSDGFIQWKYPSELTWTNLVALSVITGPAGADGADGEQGPIGPEGPSGADGEGVGIPGESAYDIAVDNGFVGDEIAWLASLEGPQGIPGEDGADGAQGIQGEEGPPGPAGVDGDSAYDIAVANGFVGDETAWLASLEGPQGPAGADGSDGAQGPAGEDGTDGSQGIQGIPGDDGDSAYDIAVTNGFVGDEVAWLASLEGPQGPAGEDGVQGPAGADGTDGVNPEGALLDDMTAVALDGTFASWVIQDDGTSTAGWPNRFSVTFDPVTGSTVETFALNEYGEPRVIPAKNNTVGFRVFGGYSPTDYINRNKEVPVFEVMTDRTNRVSKFEVMPDGDVNVAKDLVVEGDVSASNLPDIYIQSTEPGTPPSGSGLWFKTP